MTGSLVKPYPAVGSQPGAVQASVISATNPASRHQYSPSKLVGSQPPMNGVTKRPESPSASLLQQHQRLKSSATYSHSSQTLPQPAAPSILGNGPLGVQLGPKLTMTSFGMVPRPLDTPKHKSGNTRQLPLDSPASRTQNLSAHVPTSTSLHNPLQVTFGSVNPNTANLAGTLGLRPRRLSSGAKRTFN